MASQAKSLLPPIASTGMPLGLGFHCKWTNLLHKYDWKEVPYLADIGLRSLLNLNRIKKMITAIENMAYQCIQNICVNNSITSSLSKHICNWK